MSFKSLRIGILLLALAGVAAWAVGTLRHRSGRARWDHTLDVALVVLAHGAVPARTMDALRRAVPRLEQRLAAELARHRPLAPAPFAIDLLGPVPVGALPPTPEGEGLINRGRFMLALRAYLGPVDSAEPEVRKHDLRIYLVVTPAVNNQPHMVEGLGAARGDFGLVVTTIDDATVELALIAAGHELLHCLGATDKYDGAGHATPAGLVEPEASPLYPQRYAEIMVGELPTGPTQGRVTTELADLRVGAATAAELGWTTTP